MAFHETFWAITAGAAPVLGLAAVVSARDLFDVMDLFSRENSRLRPWGLDLHDEAAMIQILRYGEQLQRLWRFVSWVAIGQLANILAQACLLAVSLWAILSQANVGPPLLWLAVAVFGLAILSAAGLARIAVVGMDQVTRRAMNDKGIDAPPV